MTYDVNRARDIHRRTTLDNWSDDPALMHYTFLRFSEFFPQAVIRREGPVAALDYTLRDDIARFQVNSTLGAMALEDYVAEAPVNGVVIAEGGRIVLERYPRMCSFDRHLLMSVSKIFVSTVAGILEDRGLVDVRSGIERYLPALKDSPWDGVSVLDVLDMASGIDCPEEGIDDAYSNPDQPYYH